MAPQTQYDDWLPMGEVMARTGMSERTVYRQVTEGKLRQAQRPMPGRKPLSVYHPDDVAALVAISAQRAVQVMPPLTAALQRVAELEAKAEPDESTVMVPPENSGAIRRQDWPLPLYLTEDQAVSYSGLGLHYLRDAVQWRRIGPRGARVCRRSDLDAL